MIIGITGTPGIGKTSVCEALGMEFLELNKIIEEKSFYIGVNEGRGCLITDIDKIGEYVRDFEEERRSEKGEGNLLIESHLAHYLKPDITIVLRANPLLLRERLRKKRYDEKKIKENVQAETLDVILIEAVEMCERVYEVDTSGKSIEEVVDCIKEIISVEMGSKEEEKAKARHKYKPGSVDWSYLVKDIFNDP